jgi:hypothetical protein
MAIPLVYVMVGIAVSLPTSHPFDFAALNSPGEGWMRWGDPLLNDWKFGSNLAAYSVATSGLSSFLQDAGLPLSGAAAIHLSWKLSLLTANLAIAWALTRLLDRQDRRTRCVGLVWLLSPASFWVAAGHGQLESLALAFLAVGLLALNRGRWILAGALSGFGTGIEYFPAGVAFVVLVLLASRRIAWRQGLAFFGAFALMALLVFGPVLVSDLGRKGLLGGLATSTSVVVDADVSNLSVWRFGGRDLSNHWSVVGAVVALVVFVVSVRGARRDPDQAVPIATSGLGLLLIAAVLLNRISLPQFSVIVLFGWLLIALRGRLNPVVGVLITTCGLFVYFLDPSPDANYVSFFYDVTVGRSTLWPVKPQPDLVRLLGWTYVLGTIGALAVHRALRDRPGRLAWRGAAAAAGGLSALMLVYAVQPAVWAGVGKQGPARPAAFENFTKYEGSIAPLSSDKAVVSLPEGVAVRASRSQVRPRFRVAASVERAPLAIAKVSGGAAANELVVGVASPSRSSGHPGEMVDVSLALAQPIRGSVVLLLPGSPAHYDGRTTTSRGTVEVSFRLPLDSLIGTRSWRLVFDQAVEPAAVSTRDAGLLPASLELPVRDETGAQSSLLFLPASAPDVQLYQADRRWDAALRGDEITLSTHQGLWSTQVQDVRVEWPVEARPVRRGRAQAAGALLLLANILLLAFLTVSPVLRRERVTRVR